MSKLIDLPVLPAPQREDGAYDQGDWEEYHRELLSIADSLVLHYSLVQTRQRHIQHLFPRILTHPPVAPYNKPKAEKVTRSLLEPYTEPVLPLPALEYHDPAAEPKKKGKSDDDVEKAPAHETRCIARVTVRIGPTTYPETELWVGRFVDPKTYIKPERVKVPKEKKPAPPRPRVSLPKPIPPRPPLYRPELPRPQFQPMRPPMNQLPRPPAQRPPAPPPNSINASLIQHVNAAAARFPRLQMIIQKAAKGGAAKEELGILGRVVAKIGRNEPITAADINEGLPRPAPPAHAPAQVGAARPDSDSDLSDVEPDMTGPKQVGGGYMPGTVPTPLPAWTTRPVAAMPSAMRRPPLAFGIRPPVPHVTAPPPPPALVWPAVPRFLLLAFKDAPRNKVMIPLGLNSYISRKGGDYVTGPAPETLPTLAKTRAAREVEAAKPVADSDGTVLVSFFTSDTWKEMDWEGTEGALPWNVARSGVTVTPPLPNIATVDLLPDEGPIQAVTVTLEGLDDAAWKSMKTVMEEAEHADMKSADEYRALRKERFTALLKRVPPRRFLQTRTHAIDPAITDAMTDKYALRPYRMSNTAHTDDIEKPPSPPRKRKALEPEVTFEMPVSFDELDELVEEGAHLVGSKRGRGGAKARGRARGNGRKVDGRSTRVFVTPCRVGFPCEGCGTMGTSKNKVWRRGPGGRGTLCNPCGDAYNAGTLPPLKAPEAAAMRKAVQSLVEEPEDEEAEEVKEESVDAMQADNVEPFVKPTP